MRSCSRKCFSRARADRQQRDNTVGVPHKKRGPTRMALSLGIGFRGVIFPIRVAMRNFLKLLAQPLLEKQTQKNKALI